MYAQVHHQETEICVDNQENAFTTLDSVYWHVIVENGMAYITPSRNDMTSGSDESDSDSDSDSGPRELPPTMKVTGPKELLFTMDVVLPESRC